MELFKSIVDLGLFVVVLVLGVGTLTDIIIDWRRSRRAGRK